MKAFKQIPVDPLVSLLDLVNVRSTLSTVSNDCQIVQTYNGRSALYLYFRALADVWHTSRHTVLVPGFHCPTVVDPILHAGYKVRFYQINHDLSINHASLRQQLWTDVAAVVFINFFGFREASPELRADVKTCGAMIVDDASHSFLSWNPLTIDHHEDADATIFSFWKLLPIIHGGGLVTHLSVKKPTNRGLSYINSMRDIKALLESLLIAASLHPLPEVADPQPVVLKPANLAYPYNRQENTWKIPWYSRFILNRMNLAEVARCRRRNFGILADNLKPHEALTSICLSLDAHTVPWGFPLRLTQRAKVDYLIRANGVPVFSFGEVLHPLLYDGRSADSETVEASQLLADSLFVVGIHQGLKAQDMKNIAQIIETTLDEYWETT